MNKYIVISLNKNVFLGHSGFITSTYLKANTLIGAYIRYRKHHSKSFKPIYITRTK